MTDAEQQQVQNGTEGNGESMDQSHSKSTSNEEDRKLFIGGLSWETTEKDLNEFFSTYGEIENVNLKVDPSTGRSRGFAFVVFKTSEPVENILSSGDITIAGKKVEAKRAKARQGKIFVGGLPQEVTDDEIKAHFGAFGKVVELEMPFDKIRNQRKGFCFVTFENDTSMKELLRSGKQTLGGKEVDVKKATPRNDQMGFMRGGRGGGGFRGAPVRGAGMRGGPRGSARGGWGGGGQQWGQGYGGGDHGYDGGYGGSYGGAGNGYGGGYGYDGGYGGGYGGYGGYGDGYGQTSGAGGARGAGRGGPRGGQRYQPY